MKDFDPKKLITKFLLSWFITWQYTTYLNSSK